MEATSRPATTSISTDMQQRAPDDCQSLLRLAGLEGLRFLPIFAEVIDRLKRLKQKLSEETSSRTRGGCYLLVTNGGVRYGR